MRQRAVLHDEMIIAKLCTQLLPALCARVPPYDTVRPFHATVYGPGPVKRPRDGQVALRFDLYTAGSVMEVDK